MRILKRNLAFVLVMAMAIGMMVSANAANVEDYRDANDIKFQEAVDVLTALGILEGENGTFHPERVLTREEGAKIITYLMLGADGADNLSTSVAPFTDVAAGRWSAGFIAYCASQGIVGGYGNGTFGPTDTLTGTQFAKMLLVALGYGVNGEFTGANWEIETNKQALTAGVYEGNLGVNFSNGVKREEAAQYAFNTLAKVMQVKYSDVFGAYYSGNILDGKIEEKDEYKWTLGYNLYNLRSENVDEGDDFNRACHIWKANSKTITGNYHDDADAVYTSSVKASKIYSDLGLTNGINAKVIVDGDTEHAKTFKLAKSGDDGDKKTETIDGANIGNGVIVEAYLTDDKDGNIESVKLVVIHTYLAQVTDIDDGKVSVNVLTGAEPAVDAYETSAEYEEDDYVLVTVADGKVQSMKPVNTVEGALNSTSKNFVRFDGEQVNKAEYNAIGTDNKDMDRKPLDKDNEYTLMVDDYGYALGMVLVEESKDAKTGYLFVESIQGRNNSLLTSNAAVAEIRYLDGKGTEIMPIVTAKKTVGSEKELCFKINGATSLTLTDKDEHSKNIEDVTDNDNWFKVSDIASDDAYTVGQFFAYSVNSNDELVLTALDAEDAEGQINGQKVTFDGESIGLVGSATVRFNARSIVHVIDKDNNVKTYTGAKNIILKDKGDNVSDVMCVFTSKDSNIVKEAFVLSDAKVGGNNEVIALFRNKDNDVEKVDSDTYLVNLYTEDNKGHVYTVDKEGYDVLTGAGIYVITLVDDDEISEIITLTKYDTDNEDVLVTSDKEVVASNSDGFTVKTVDDSLVFADKYVVMDDTDGLKVGNHTLLKAEVLNDEDEVTRTGAIVTYVEYKEEVVFVLVTTASAKVPAAD